MIQGKAREFAANVRVYIRIGTCFARPDAFGTVKTLRTCNTFAKVAGISTVCFIKSWIIIVKVCIYLFCTKIIR